MLIEPTESESLFELDRFCEAMIAIREEIRAIEQGRGDWAENLLKRPPLTADLLIWTWTRPFGEVQAFYPVPAVKEHKYRPPEVGVDNAYRHGHLVCSCPPIEAHQQAKE